MRTKFFSAVTLLIVTIMLITDTVSALPNQYYKPGINFFKLPFPTGRWWRMSGGPHPLNGKSGILTSIDLKPFDHSGCGAVDSRDYVVAAAAGKVIYNKTAEPNLVIIDHLNGWFTHYMHLTSIKVSNGTTVTKDQPLGYPSCLGGDADGAHVHFSLAYGGIRTYQPIDGIVFEDWTVQASSENYEGCLKHNITLQPVCRVLGPTSATPDKSIRSMRATVEIRSIYSNKVLTIPSGVSQSFTQIIQSKWSDLNYQKWYLIPLDGADRKYYRIRSAHANKCLDIRDFKTNDSAELQLYDCTGGDNQKFSFVQIPGYASGTYYIVAKHSNKVLDVTNWSLADIGIQQWSRETQENQYWKMVFRVLK